MEENFKIEIIRPEKIVFSDNSKMVTLPSYEGDMSVLKNHVSIITFLRPGIISIQKNEGNFERFIVQDGIIEYLNDSLIVLSSSAINVKDLSKDFLSNLEKSTQNKLTEKNISDHERYILNHKLDMIKDLRI